MTDVLICIALLLSWFQYFSVTFHIHVVLPLSAKVWHDLKNDFKNDVLGCFRRINIHLSNNFYRKWGDVLSCMVITNEFLHVCMFLLEFVLFKLIITLTSTRMAPTQILHHRNKYSLLIHCIKIKSPVKFLLNEQYVFVGGNIYFLCVLSCSSEEA